MDQRSADFCHLSMHYHARHDGCCKFRSLYLTSVIGFPPQAVFITDSTLEESGLLSSVRSESIEASWTWLSILRCFTDLSDINGKQYRCRKRLHRDGKMHKRDISVRQCLFVLNMLLSGQCTNPWPVKHSCAFCENAVAKIVGVILNVPKSHRVNTKCSKFRKPLIGSVKMRKQKWIKSTPFHDQSCISLLIKTEKGSNSYSNTSTNLDVKNDN